MITSMAVRDDILSGDSYFIKEIKYLKRILDALSEDKLVICVIDEILRGTNTQERIAASKAIMEYLAHHNCIAIVASHDKELTELEKIGYDNYHFPKSLEKRILYLIINCRRDRRIPRMQSACFPLPGSRKRLLRGRKISEANIGKIMLDERNDIWYYKQVEESRVSTLTLAQSSD